MSCPNCGFSEITKNICNHCGVDVVLYKKASGISNALYNKAINNINNRDLTTAINELNKSISFNKNNIDARNLLGLAYFECGLVGDAIKHWVISSSILKEKNLANEYITKLQRNTRLLEKYSDSIKMYNQALVYLRQKSEDMAIIQLKKSLELNPNFIDALNLLALCYLLSKDNARVLQNIEKVLSIDANNAIALSYYKDVKHLKQRVDAKEEIPRQKKSAVQQNIYRNKEQKSIANTFHITEILCFIIGVICAASIFTILVIPSRMQAKDAEIATNKEQNQIDIKEYEKTIGDERDKIKQLEEEVKNLTLKNETANEQLNKQDRIIKINKAFEISRKGNLEEAADILYYLDSSGLPIDTVELLESLKNEIYPKLSLNLYNSGVAKYNKKEYDDSKVLLEKSIQYTREGASNSSGVLYYLALTMEAKQDKEAAKQYLQELIEKYPKSSFINNAKKRLQNLQ